MSIKKIVTSEDVFKNPNLNEIGSNLKNTQQEHDQKHCDNYFGKFMVMSNLNFWIK